MSSIAETAGRIDESALAQREIDHARRRERRVTSLVFSWRGVVLVALLLSWYYASGRIVDSLFVSNPVKVVDAFREYVDNGQLAYHLRFTVIEMILGYSIGAIAGLILAAGVAMSAAFHGIVRPYLMAFYATPTIAIAPLMIVWLGFGVTPKVVIAAIFVFFIVFMMTLGGIQSVSKSLVDVASVLGASRRQVMLKIVFPSAIPNVMTALRVSVPEAMVGVVIGEFIGGNHGIGYLAEAAAGRYNTAGVFAVIAAILVIVLLLDSLLTIVERYALKWRPEATAGSRGTS